MSRWKIRRSAGVPVTRAVHALIASGNAARDRRDWARAAERYGTALDADAGLAHIQMQYGHALKELGKLDRAEAAYLKARERLPDDADPSLHLGHISKLRGNTPSASRHYLDAFQKDPVNPDASAELHRVIAAGSGRSREEMLKVVLSKVGADLSHSSPVARIARTSDDGDERALVFDASDLIAYFRHARLPTGIQRVQIETIASAFGDPAAKQVMICCFIDGRDDWLEIPTDLFLAVIEMSVQSDDRREPQWVALLNRLRLALALSDPMIFPRGSCLVNLGTSWWLQNYFLYVRQAKRDFGIRYVPLVYDLIPIIAPEHCIKALTQDFISWLLGVFDHADHYLTISEATKRDLISVADDLGHELDPADVQVIPLDADFKKPLRSLADPAMLRSRGLEPEGYVLFVSTIESRKNHILAFDVWSELLRLHDAAGVPQLVCVGGRGWLNETIYERLSRDELLRSKVTMLSGIADAELDLLYRSCLFTLYPSLYEGWGLPVTESLCYGKVPVVSDSSSLPEAGGIFAAFFKSGSLAALFAVLEQLIFDPAVRPRLEAKIANEFKPRSWADVGRQIHSHLAVWVGTDRHRVGGFALPAIRIGRYYPLQRNTQTRIWRGLALAEMYRSGLGWRWPESRGCWTRPAGGELTLPLPGAHGALRLYFQLRGLPNRTSDFVLVSKDGAIDLRGQVAAGAACWVRAEIAPSDMPHNVNLTLRGSDEENLPDGTSGMPGGGISVGLIAFFTCELADADVRSDFIEAAALNDFSRLDAYRPTAP